MRVLTAIMIFLSCTSCAHVVPPVNVTYHCPLIVLPKDPVLPIKKLTAKSRPDEVAKAWVATAVAYKSWDLAVRKQIADSQKVGYDFKVESH